MHLKIRSLVALFLVLAAVEANAAPWEAKARDCLCADIEREVAVEKRGLPGRPPATDCVSQEHAIEIDSTDHYKQAIGQALYSPPS